MIIKKEKKEKVRIILSINIDKFARILTSCENIEYIFDNVSTTQLNSSEYQLIYKARSIFVMHMITIIAQINTVIILGNKTNALATLYYKLDVDKKTNINNVDLDFLDVQFLYKQVKEITTNFLRYDKESKRYLCKATVYVYKIIEDIDKFNFVSKYVLLKIK